MPKKKYPDEKDLINKIFGDLTVVQELPRKQLKLQRKPYNRRILCVCVCGKTKEVPLNSLMQPRPTGACSAWCRRRRHPTVSKDRCSHHIGLKSGRLLVESILPKVKGMGRRCVCLCDPILGGCGNRKEFEICHLTSKKIKSCGCLNIEKLKARPKKDLGNKKPYGEASFNKLYGTYKRNAKIRNYDFVLNKDVFKYITSSNCYYCGSVPSNIKLEASAHGEYVYSGIDRVDNNKGYTIDNCVSCCIKCNRAKHAMGQIEFYAWLEKTYKYSIDNIKNVC